MDKIKFAPLLKLLITNDMKKVFSLLACATVAFASCTLTKEDGTSGPVIVNPDDVLVGKTEVLDPDTQKVKLEQVGTKLMDVFPASEYEDLVEVSEVFASHCDRYYNDEDYDCDRWKDQRKILP